MKDIISVNRSFLLMARAIATSSSAKLVTGLPASMLERLKDMSLEQIDTLASNLPVSAFTMRFNEQQIDQMVTGMKSSNAPAYAMSILPVPAH